MCFGGDPIRAVPGETIAAALLAAGRPAQGTGRDGAPRGLFCGMGACQECLVVADGRAGTRACLAKVRDGMVVEPQPYRVAAGIGLADLTGVPEAIAQRSVDVLVVGAGPAGLEAAAAARAAGAAVLLVDERPGAGGQFFKQPATRGRRSDAQSRRGAALIHRALALGVEMLADTMVWGAAREADGRLTIGGLGPDGALTVRPRILVVATGAIEAPPLLPGWTLPGVMTTGALQSLVRSHGAVPRGRILVAGNGPLNLQTACELVRAGADLVGLVDAAPPPWTRPQAARGLLGADPVLAARGMLQIARLRTAGVAIHWSHRVVRVTGAGRAERIVIAPSTGCGSEREIAAATLAIGEGFWPADELARLVGCAMTPNAAVRRHDSGATSLDDVFVIGEAGGFGGAEIALAQGALAGREAARRLGLSAPDQEHATRRRLARHRRFQSALRSLFDAPQPGLDRADADTIVCRCEAIRLGALETMIATRGIEDLGSLKRLSRAGMGRCQARYCGPALCALLARSGAADPDTLAPQMPLRPVPVAALALEKPEWGGHRRVLLPGRPGSACADPLPRADAEVVVIGAGIAGLSTALFLARGGCDTVVLDRGQPHALASGGNAGSLHAQLLSFDHGARAGAGGTPAARTLPLQRDSIALWADLERDLGADFEMSLTGGLMVAESERDLAFLARKTETERRHGIDCHVIGRADVRRLEPALADGILGAAYCPGEGKINPLAAGEAILAAAQAAGACVLRRAEVLAISPAPGGFRIETSRGPLRAGRIVNAAGAFASVIGDMVGLRVPVFGAPLQMIVTEAAAPLVSGLVAHADRHLTLKQAANGNLLIGGGWTAGLDPVHGHPRPLMASLEGNLWIAQAVVPALRGLRIIRSWAAMNIDIDGAPILGAHPDRPGIFTAVTSNGYTLGPLVGRITAQLMMHGEADRDVSGFGLGRFEERPA